MLTALYKMGEPDAYSAGIGKSIIDLMRRFAYFVDMIRLGILLCKVFVSEIHW